MSFWDFVSNAVESVGSFFGGDEDKKPMSDADKLMKASEGLGTDEDAIYDVLKGKSPEETAKLKNEYMKKSGGSLDDMLKDELSGDELKKATSLMGGGGGLKDVAKGADVVTERKGGGIGDIVGGAAKGMISGAMGPVAGMMMGGGKKKGGWFD